MMKYIDGIYYILYWRQHGSKYSNFNDAGPVTLMGMVLGLVVFALVGILSIYIPGMYNYVLSSNLLFPLLFMPMLFLSIYFKYNKRKRKIIRKHKLYKNCKYKLITYLLFLPGAFFMLILYAILASLND